MNWKLVNEQGEEVANYVDQLQAKVAELEEENELLKGRKNVRLDTNSGNGKPEQQRKLDSTMEMGQLLEGSENKGSSYIETEGVIILDTFRGDIFQLTDSIKSLVELDIENALVPHGIGGLARSLLSSSAIRLEQLRQRVAELEQQLIEVRRAERERVAQYIENQSLPDCYSEPCLAEFAEEIRAME